MDELLAETEFESISVGEIARRAAVSPATVYQRFTNKDAAAAILIELYIRKVDAWNRSDAGKVDVAGAATLREALVLVGLAACRQLDALRYVVRPAYLYSRLKPDLLHDLWQAQERRAVEGFQRMLEAFPSDVGSRDLPRSASMIAYFFNMMFLGRLLHADESSWWGLPCDADAFSEELADFVSGYLSTPSTTNRGHRGRRSAGSS